MPLAVTARGANLSTLLGVIDVAIPNTRTYRLRGQLVKQGEEYHFTRITGVAGKTDLAGKLTITNGERIHLDSVLATKSLDIVDAAPFIGYNPDIVESRGAVAAAAATGAGAQRLLPDGNFPVETMQIFDADLKWTIGVVRSKNIPISNVDLTLDLERGRLALSPLTFAMARGNVASDASSTRGRGRARCPTTFASRRRRWGGCSRAMGLPRRGRPGRSRGGSSSTGAAIRSMIRWRRHAAGSRS